MRHPTQPFMQGSNKKLWAALLVLLVLLLAMGATLIRIQSQPFEPRTVVLPQPAQDPVTQMTSSDTTSEKSPTTAAPAASAAAGSVNPTTPASAKNPTMNVPATVSDQAQDATGRAGLQAIQITDKPRPLVPRTPEPAVARPPAASGSATPGPAAQ